MLVDDRSSAYKIYRNMFRNDTFVKLERSSYQIRNLKQRRVHKAVTWLGYVYLYKELVWDYSLTFRNVWN